LLACALPTRLPRELRSQQQAATAAAGGMQLRHAMLHGALHVLLVIVCQLHCRKVSYGQQQ
jgi:hypothetical protein